MRTENCLWNWSIYLISACPENTLFLTNHQKWLDWNSFSTKNGPFPTTMTDLSPRFLQNGHHFIDKKVVRRPAENADGGSTGQDSGCWRPGPTPRSNPPVPWTRTRSRPRCSRAWIADSTAGCFRRIAKKVASPSLILSARLNRDHERIQFFL